MTKSRFDHFYGGVRGKDFFGRAGDLAELDAFLDAPKPVHMALYGLPHVGKTSLMSEWKRRLEQAGNRSACGQPLLILEQTINLDDAVINTVGVPSGNGKSYYAMLRLLLRNMYSQIQRARKDGRLPAEDDELDDACGMLRLQARELNGDPEDAMEFFVEAVRTVGYYGLRTLILLDEFERAGQSWSEEEYLAFVHLLMDRSLDLRCVVASRPHISYVISDYVQKIAPFRPYLLEGFNDEDMTEYFRILKEETGVDYLCGNRKKERREIIYACNRNPYLLTLMGRSLVAAAKMEDPGSPEIRPYRAFFANREEYYDHFSDVVRFMLYEEQREKKSFTHIVKCYFGVSEDYTDIIGNYRKLGYVEYSEKKSPFAYEDDRYVYRDSRGQEYYYTTVCPAFIHYIYRRELHNVRDTRILVMGLYHAVRDVVRREYERIFADSTLSWNQELFRRMCARKNGSVYYPVQFPDGGWEILSRAQLQKDYTYCGECFAASENVLKGRLDWIMAHEDELIVVSDTSLRFAKNAYNERINRVMPVLDPISLEDTRKLMMARREVFDPYFVLEGEYLLTEENIEKITDMRNEISHFSRYGILDSQQEEFRQLSIRILRSIYQHMEML